MVTECKKLIHFVFESTKEVERAIKLIPLTESKFVNKRFPALVTSEAGARIIINEFNKLKVQYKVC